MTMALAIGIFLVLLGFLYVWFGRQGLIAGGLIYFIGALVLKIGVRFWRYSHKMTARQYFDRYVYLGDLSSKNDLLAMSLCEKDLARVRVWREKYFRAYTHTSKSRDLERLKRADEMVQIIKNLLMV